MIARSDCKSVNSSQMLRPMTANRAQALDLCRVSRGGR